MSTAKLWGLIAGFTVALMVLLTGISYATNGWIAHLLSTSGSVIEVVVLLSVFAMPCLVIGVAFAFALEKPLDQTL